MIDLASLRRGADYTIVYYQNMCPLFEGMNSIYIWINATDSDMFYDDYIKAVVKRGELSFPSSIITTPSGKVEDKETRSDYHPELVSLHTCYQIIFNKADICLETIYLNNKVKFNELVKHFHSVCLEHFYDRSGDPQRNKGMPTQVIRVMFRGRLSLNSISGIEYWTGLGIYSNTPKCYFTLDIKTGNKRDVSAYSHGSLCYTKRSEPPPPSVLNACVTKISHPPYQCFFIKEVIHLGRNGERLSDQAHIIYLETPYKPIYNPNRLIDWRRYARSENDAILIKSSYKEMFHFGRKHAVIYPICGVPFIPTPSVFNDFGIPDDKLYSILINDRLEQESDTNQPITTTLILPLTNSNKNNNMEPVNIPGLSSSSPAVDKHEEEVEKEEKVPEQKVPDKKILAISSNGITLIPFTKMEPVKDDDNDDQEKEEEQEEQEQEEEIKTKRRPAKKRRSEVDVLKDAAKRPKERHSSRLELKKLKEVVSLLLVLKEKLGDIDPEIFKEALKAIEERFTTATV